MSNTMLFKVVLASVFSFGLFKSGYCIDCHQCASKDDGSDPPFCADPYDGNEMGDNIDGCDDKDTHCLKSKVVSYLNDAGFILGKPRESVAVTRGCIRADGERDHCKYIEADSGFFLVCICSEDGCNGTSGVLASLTLTLIIATVGQFIRRLL